MEYHPEVMVGSRLELNLVQLLCTERGQQLHKCRLQKYIRSLEDIMPVLKARTSLWGDSLISLYGGFSKGDAAGRETDLLHESTSQPVSGPATCIPHHRESGCWNDSACVVTAGYTNEMWSELPALALQQILCRKWERGLEWQDRSQRRSIWGWARPSPPATSESPGKIGVGDSRLGLESQDTDHTEQHQEEQSDPVSLTHYGWRVPGEAQYRVRAAGAAHVEVHHVGALGHTCFIFISMVFICVMPKLKGRPAPYPREKKIPKVFAFMLSTN